MDAELARRLDEVRGRMALACSRARRPVDSVTLIAVSKTVPAARIRNALAAGQLRFGENRVQEALTKMPEVGSGARWDLVGHLQRNKAKLAIGRFELIHSVGDALLARELERRAAAAGHRQPILLQLNLGEEASKHGTDAAGLLPLLEEVTSLPHLDPRGLMAIPPPGATPEDSRPWFRELFELRERARPRSGIALDELSMGMSEDFEVAIEEGATLVRVGRAIFGDRPTN